LSWGIKSPVKNTMSISCRNGIMEAGNLWSAWLHKSVINVIYACLVSWEDVLESVLHCYSGRVTKAIGTKSTSCKINLGSLSAGRWPTAQTLLAGDVGSNNVKRIDVDVCDVQDFQGLDVGLDNMIMTRLWQKQVGHDWTEKLVYKRVVWLIFKIANVNDPLVFFSPVFFFSCSKVYRNHRL
jgi:hypothetical protein